MKTNCKNCGIEIDDTNKQYPEFPHIVCSLECAKELKNKEKAE